MPRTHAGGDPASIQSLVSLFGAGNMLGHLLSPSASDVLVRRGTARLQYSAPRVDRYVVDMVPEPCADRVTKQSIKQTNKVTNRPIN